MKRENISDIRRRLEPSAELKRRVMERAAKLEAGGKTFGNGEITTDNKQPFKTKEKKENITMSINKTNNEMNTVKSHFPAAVLSVAACAALVIGIAAVGLRGGDNELVTDKEAITAPAVQSAADSSSVTDEPFVIKTEDEPDPKNIMTVTDNYRGEYTITDKDRIAAIDALVEKAKKSHVYEGEYIPAERTLEYYVNGEQKTVEISEELIAPHEWHPDNYPKVEISHVVTINSSESYAICEFVPDEPLWQLISATAKGGNLSLQKWNDKSDVTNNEDDFDDGSFYQEYRNEADARKLKDIVDDIRRDSAPQFEIENMYDRNNENLPSWEEVRAACNFDIDGINYDIELYRDSDLIGIGIIDWHDGKNRTELYKVEKSLIAEIDEAFGSLTDNSAEWEPEQDHYDEPEQEEYVAPPAGKVRLPELYGLTEEQAVAALKEIGMNCVIDYRFEDGVEKGHVIYFDNPDFDADYSTDYYDYASKGTYIVLNVSLGEYEGQVEMVKPDHATGYYPSKKSTLEVPVPDGLSGSYTFSIYIGYAPTYTNTADNINGVKSVPLDVYASDKERYVVYAKNNNSEKEELIRYATYEFDYAAETWTLIGELNTEELLGTMNR